MSELQTIAAWDELVTVAGRSVALPNPPERPDPSPDGAELVVAAGFGDGFGVLAGPEALLGAAIAAILDELYGTEWGTAEAPAITAASGRASLVAFGQEHRAAWREYVPGTWLVAVVRPGQEALAEAFVAGGSIRGSAA